MSVLFLSIAKFLRSSFFCFFHPFLLQNEKYLRDSPTFLFSKDKEKEVLWRIDFETPNRLSFSPYFSCLFVEREFFLVCIFSQMPFYQLRFFFEMPTMLSIAIFFLLLVPKRNNQKSICRFVLKGKENACTFFFSLKAKCLFSERKQDFLLQKQSLSFSERKARSFRDQISIAVFLPLLETSLFQFLWASEKVFHHHIQSIHNPFRNIAGIQFY